MTASLLALSISNTLLKAGALAAFVGLVGIAILSLLVFSQAREIKRLREWAGRAPERAAELEQRVSAEATIRDRSRETRASGAGRFGDASGASVSPIGPRFDQRIVQPSPPGAMPRAAGGAPIPRATPMVTRATGAQPAPGTAAHPIGDRPASGVALTASGQPAPAQPVATPAPGQPAFVPSQALTVASGQPAPVAEGAAQPTEESAMPAAGQPKSADAEEPAPQAEAVEGAPRPGEGTSEIAQGESPRVGDTPGKIAPAMGEASSKVAPATAAAVAAAAAPIAVATRVAPSSSPAPSASVVSTPMSPPRAPTPPAPVRAGTPAPPAPARPNGDRPPAPESPRSPAPRTAPGRPATARPVPPRPAPPGGARVGRPPGPPFLQEERRGAGKATMLIVGGVVVGVAVLAGVLLSAGGSNGNRSPTQPAASSHAASTGRHGRQSHGAPAVVGPGETHVVVINATEANGLAHRLAEHLQQGGYAQAAALEVHPPSGRSTSVVQYASGHRTEALRVGRALGIGETAPLESTIAPLVGSATVVVIAGADQAAQAGAGSGEAPAGTAGGESSAAGAGEGGEASAAGAGGEASAGTAGGEASAAP